MKTQRSWNIISWLNVLHMSFNNCCSVWEFLWCHKHFWCHSPQAGRNVIPLVGRNVIPDWKSVAKSSSGNVILSAFGSVFWILLHMIKPNAVSRVGETAFVSGLSKTGMFCQYQLSSLRLLTCSRPDWTTTSVLLKINLPSIVLLKIITKWKQNCFLGFIFCPWGFVGV